MAEKKSGPVKPPTLEMQARKTSGRTPRKAEGEAGARPETPDNAATREKPEAAGHEGASGDGPAAGKGAGADSRKTSGETSHESSGKGHEKASSAEKASGPADKSGDAGSAGRKTDETGAGSKPATPSAASGTGAGSSESGGAKTGAGRSAAAQTGTARPGSGATQAPGSSRSSGGGVVAGALAGALGGAAIGVGVVLYLAGNGMLGGLMPEETSDLPDRVTATEEQVSESLVGFNALDDRIGEIGREIEALDARLDEEVAPLAGRQTQLEEAMAGLEDPPTEPVDLTPLEERLDSLGARIDAVASGADGAQASAIGEDIAALRSDVDGLQSEIETFAAAQERNAERLETVAGTAEAASQGIADIEIRLSEVESGLAAQADEPAMAELPLALSGLQSAIERGRPFAAELDRLTAALPRLAVPDAVSAAAPEGLPRPDTVAERFSRAMPTIMAARPVDSDAGWAATAWRRVKALLAVRPSGAGSGDPVETALAEAENAVAGRDFGTAAAALGQLPDEMRQAAGAVATDIETLAAAQRLLNEARNVALSAPQSSPESVPAGEEAPA